VTKLRGAVPYAVAGVLLALNVIFVPVRHNDFGWEALLRRPDTSVRPFVRSELFEKGKTYRILSSRDGKTPMYDLIRSGALLDSEFFPESINRRSFADTAEYVRFLDQRKVDYVIIYALYDTAHGTNEHALLDQMLEKPTDGVCTGLIAVVNDDRLIPVTGALVVAQLRHDGTEYWVYRVDRQACSRFAEEPFSYPSSVTSATEPRV